jgi:hypothetical protein|tara:strand:- start:1950 stop:2123 length:174 start_codon:yes stop_codon:yes gene_type:complete
MDVIKNLPETIYEHLYNTDQRFKTLIIQLEHAQSTQDDDQKDIVLSTIHNEYGKEFI